MTPEPHFFIAKRSDTFVLPNSVFTLMRVFGFGLLIVFSCFDSFAQATADDSGNAIKLDGIDDYIDFGDVYADLKMPFTISAWVNLGPSGKSAPVFTNRNCDPIYIGFRLIVSNTVISMDYGDGFGGNNPAFRKGKNASVSIKSGKWNHVSVVVSGPSSIELYLNGVNVGGAYSGSSSRPMDSSKPGFASSGYFVSNGTVYRYEGLLDEIRLWNRALSETEIRQTMCVKLAGDEPGLIGYWNFDEASGTDIFDKSSRHINGVFRGNPLRERSGAPVGDESTFSYQSNWSNQVISFNVGDQAIAVSNVSATTQGIHIYAVKSAPGNTAGISNIVIPDTYFGVFLAQQESSSTFSVGAPNVNPACSSMFQRKDNTSASWASASIPLQNVAERMEIIVGSSTVKPPQLNLGPDKILCDGDVFQISTGMTDPAYKFLWNNGSVSPAITVNQPGTYSVIIEGPCSTQTDEVQIEFLEPPTTFSLGADVKLCGFREIVLNIPVDEFSSIEWQDGSKNSTFNVHDYGTYWATVKNICGEVSDTIVISRPDLQAIPNVITPDANGKNDFFVIPDQYEGPVSLTIFNRWGNLVYENNSYKNNWSGDTLSPGLYFYTVRTQCFSDIKGTLTILKSNP